jgi:hypothetical protein
VIVLSYSGITRIRPWLNRWKIILLVFIVWNTPMTDNTWPQDHMINPLLSGTVRKWSTSSKLNLVMQFGILNTSQIARIWQSDFIMQEFRSWTKNTKRYLIWITIYLNFKLCVLTRKEVSWLLAKTESLKYGPQIALNLSKAWNYKANALK